VYVEGDTQCNLIGPKEVNEEVFEMSQPHSLMEKIPEKKIKYSKSYDNLNDALAIETETEYNEFGEPIGMKKEMSIQCSPEQM